MNEMKKYILAATAIMLVSVCSLTGCDKKNEYTISSGNIEILGIDNNEMPSEDVNIEVLGIDNNEMPSEDVAKEKVDLIFFMGQSNMAGYGGDAGKAPKVDENKGLEYRVISDPNTLHPIEEPFGLYEDNANGLADKTGFEGKKGSLVSAFINEYYDRTNHKTIAVSASVGGMAMDLWLIESFWNDCKERVKNSYDYLISNNYEVENVYLIWFQGESDIARLVPADSYGNDFHKFMNSLIDEGVEQIFLIVPNRTGTEGDVICDFQEELCKTDNMYTLGSTMPTELAETGLAADNIHFTQESLNSIGVDTAKSVAEYTNSR